MPASVTIGAMQHLTKLDVEAGPSRATAGFGKTFLRGLKHFHEAPFMIFFLFKMVHSDVLFKFLADGGAPKRSEARGS